MNVGLRFRVLGEPARLRILNLIRAQGEVSVGYVAQELEIIQQNASRHLQIMHEVGILSHRRQGRLSLYSVKSERIFEVCDAMAEI